jgi:hypothetical protein
VEMRFGGQFVGLENRSHAGERIIAACGSGPMPASPTTRKPLRGPDIPIPSAEPGEAGGVVPGRRVVGAGDLHLLGLQ